VGELIRYFHPVGSGQAVQAVPGAGLDVPIWILGSSLFGAELAAAMGLPFAFASHFAPALMTQAVELYRLRFNPSHQLERPYVMLGVNVFAAGSDAEAERLFSSLQQAFVRLRLGRPGQLPPPISGYGDRLTEVERAIVNETLACSIVGSPETVRQGLETFVAENGADELMVTSQIFDHAARLRSYEITAQARDAISGIAALQPATPA
jgi:luciferase family oxidoreductase group 1